MKWESLRLAEIIIENSKSKIKVRDSSEIGAYPFFTSGDKIKKLDESICKGENIFVATGGKANFKYFNGKASYSTDCYSIKTNEKVIVKYLYYFLVMNKEIINKRMFKGAALKHLQKKEFKDIEISIPNLTEQQRIVAKLDATIAEIDKAIEIENGRKEEITSLFNSRVTELLKILMHERKHIKLKDLCERITVGYVGKMSNQYTEHGIQFLRSQSIRPYRISREGLLHISEEFNKSISKSQLKTNDVCVVRTGYPGTAAVVTEEWNGSNCSDLVIFTPSSDLNPYFLELFFNSDYGKALVLGKVVGAAQKHFNVTSAKEVDFPLASINEQARIVSTSESLRNSWETASSAITKKIENLTRLKSAILVKELQSSEAA